MNILSIRDKSVCVSSSTYYALRAIAEIHHHGCLDELADAWLAERLAQDPVNARRQKLFAEAMKEIDRQLKAEKLSMKCSCIDHPVYGVEVDHCCPLHGDRCEHGKLGDEPCAQCEASAEKLSDAGEKP